MPLSRELLSSFKLNTINSVLAHGGSCYVPAGTAGVLDGHGQHRPVGELGALVHRDVKPVEIVMIMKL